MIPNLVEHQHSVKKILIEPSHPCLSDWTQTAASDIFFDAKRTKQSLYNVCVHADICSSVCTLPLRV